MALTSRDRIHVFERDGYRCGYCRLTVDVNLPHDHPRCATVDHVVARSKGGSNKPDNLVTACRRCNGDKADMGADTFRWFRRMLARGHDRETLLVAIEIVEAENASAAFSAEEERQINAWAKAGLDYVRQRRASKRGVAVAPAYPGKVINPVQPSTERAKTKPARVDPYAKVLGKAYKGTLMHAWLNGDV